MKTCSRRFVSRFLALCLSAVMLLTVPLEAKASGYDLPIYTDLVQMNEFRTDLYDPPYSGYYGYLAMEFCGTEAKRCSIPVLVKNGCILIQAGSFAAEAGLGLSEPKKDVVRLSAFEKTVEAEVGKTKLTLQQGRVSEEYDAGPATMYQDGEYWIPLQEICYLFGMQMLPCMDRGGFLSVLLPQEDVLDIAVRAQSIVTTNLEELYDMNFFQKEVLSKSSRIVDDLDGILHFEGDKAFDFLALVNPYYAVKELVFGRDEENTYARDIVTDILNMTDMEVKFLQSDSYDQIDAFFNSADILSSLPESSVIIMDELMTGGKHALPGRIDWKPLYNRISKISTGIRKTGGVSDFLTYLGIGKTLAVSVVRSYDILEDIRNQDDMARNGLRTGLERAKEDKDKKAIRRLQYSIDSIISAYEFEGIKSDLSKWRMIAEKNMSDVLDMIFSSAIGAPAVVLDKLYVTTTGLCEPMKQDLASAEAYQKSAVASGITEDLQAVVTEAYGELFKGTGKNSFRSEKLEEFVELLYAYIKADYITRSYGLTAMIRQQNKNSNWSAEERRVEEDAKMLAVLAAYSDGTFRDPEEMHELFQSEMPQNFLMNYVTPSYACIRMKIEDDTAEGEAAPDDWEVSMRFEDFPVLNFPFGPAEILDEEDRLVFYLPLPIDEESAKEMYPDLTDKVDEIAVSCRKKGSEEVAPLLQEVKTECIDGVYTLDITMKAAADEVLVTTQNLSSEADSFHISISHPIVSLCGPEETEAEKKINADLNTIYESACNTADQCSTPGGFYDFYMTEVGYVGGILSITFDETIYAGGARPIHGQYSVQYDMETGERFSAGNLIKKLDSDARQSLQKLLETAFSKYSLMGSTASLAKSAVSGSGNWSLSPEGLTVSFNPGDVASYSEGYITAALTPGQLKNILPETYFAAVKQTGTGTLTHADPWPQTFEGKQYGEQTACGLYIDGEVYELRLTHAGGVYLYLSHGRTGIVSLPEESVGILNAEYYSGGAKMTLSGES